MLKPGDTAPAFDVALTGGGRASLSQFLGKKNVVLFFYPGDFTPGCTKEACSYRDNYAAFAPLDAVLLGVSANSDSSHTRFAASYRLPFSLIADTDRSLARAYHVLWLGGLLPLPRRITFVIDKQGVIRLAAHHELAIDDHVRDALEILRTLERRGM